MNKFKKATLLAVILSAGLGCAYIKEEHISQCKQICESNGGLKQIVAIGSSGGLTCECANGMQREFAR